MGISTAQVSVILRSTTQQIIVSLLVIKKGKNKDAPWHLANALFSPHFDVHISYSLIDRFDLQVLTLTRGKFII
jgi:hypothetical protein